MTTKILIGESLGQHEYTECGLDDVIIEGLEIVVDDAGDGVYCIPCLPSLHRAIAHSIITRESGVSGKELRFLRTEMGLSQAEMAELIKVSRATVNRWERGKTDINPSAGLIIRRIASEQLEIDSETPLYRMYINILSSHANDH